MGLDLVGVTDDLRICDSMGTIGVDVCLNGMPRVSLLFTIVIAATASTATAQLHPAGGLSPPARATPRVELKTGRVVVTGKADVAAIERVLRRARTRLRICVERDVATGWTGRAKIELAITIDTSGLVTNATIAASTMTAKNQVEGCLTSQVSRVRFPAAESEVRARIPLLFAFFDRRGATPAPAAATGFDLALDQARHAKTRARCLDRAGARLARLARLARRSGPRTRARLAPRIALAQTELDGCLGLALLGQSLGSPCPTLPLTPGCPGCRD